MSRVRALRSLRWNFRRRGVWVWLKARHCVVLWDTHYDRSHSRNPDAVKRSGWWLVLRYPRHVAAEQEALADGVTS